MIHHFCSLFEGPLLVHEAYCHFSLLNFCPPLIFIDTVEPPSGHGKLVVLAGLSY